MQCRKSGQFFSSPLLFGIHDQPGQPLIHAIAGCWARATPLKNMKVNWDDEIPNIWDNKIDVPNHQPDSMTTL